MPGTSRRISDTTRVWRCSSETGGPVLGCCRRLSRSWMGGRVLAVGCCGPLFEEGWGIAQPCVQVVRRNNICPGMGCCCLCHDHGHGHALARHVDLHPGHAPCLSQTAGRGRVPVRFGDCRRAVGNVTGHAVVHVSVVVRAVCGGLGVGVGVARSGFHVARRVETPHNGGLLVRWTVGGDAAVLPGLPMPI